MADAVDVAVAFYDERMQATIEAHRSAVCGCGSDICVDCGCDIPVKRRAAFPASVRCIHCQFCYESG